MSDLLFDPSEGHAADSSKTPRRSATLHKTLRRVAPSGSSSVSQASPGDADVATRSKPLGSADRQTETLLEVRNLSRVYKKAGQEIPVLTDVSLTTGRGEFVSIIGQSGSGKSTLLHLIGTLDQPDGGEVHLEGVRIDRLPRRKKDRIRNRDVAMIFQFYHLLPELTTLENVLMPAMIAEPIWRYPFRRAAHIARAKAVLDRVGLSHRLTHRSRELSGGEMQRAAVARALVTRPKLLLADEPTGNLDRKNGREVMNLLTGLAREEALSIIMVTHDSALAHEADRVLTLADGRLVGC